MIERPFYFPQGDLSLFGVLHEGAGADRRLPFVFCHPLAEEKLWTHRVLVTFARELARLGHTVLRFDQRGNGDSEGEFCDFTVHSAVADVECAIELTKRITSAAEVGLLGLRFGATLAALVAEQRSDVRRLILWAPVTDGHSYAQDLLRVNLATQLAVFKQVRQDRAALVELMEEGQTVNVDGYPMANELYQQLSGVALAKTARQFDWPVLIVHVDRNAGVGAPAELQALERQYRAATLSIAEEEPFWKEIRRFYETAPNLFARTLAWVVTP